MHLMWPVVTSDELLRKVLLAPLSPVLISKLGKVVESWGDFSVPASDKMLT